MISNDVLAKHLIGHQTGIAKTVFGVTVTLIIVTTLALIGYVNIYSFTPMLDQIFNLNLSLILVGIYIVFYLIHDVIVGLLTVPWLISGYVLANLFRFYVPYAWVSAVLIQVFSWMVKIGNQNICQTVEARNASVKQNIIDTYIAGPYLIILWLLFSCGFRARQYEQLDDLTDEQENMI